jgi:hypothetical protein
MIRPGKKNQEHAPLMQPGFSDAPCNRFTSPVVRLDLCRDNHAAGPK